MKKYIYATMAALILFIGCKDTNENLVQERGAAVVPQMSDPVPAYFTDNIDASYVQFDLSLSQGETVEKAVIEVTRARGDKRAIVKEVTLPANGLKVTADEVLKTLNIPVNDYKLGDIFNLCVLLTKDGKTTRSKAAFSIPVVCYFDPSMLVGMFDWVSDDWGEEGEGMMVADPNNQYKIYFDMAKSEGLSGNGKKIELNVNPNNFKVTGPKVIISDDLSEWGLPYHDYAFEPIAGSYSACDNQYTITFAISVKEGSFGNNVFIFTKR